MILRFNCHSVNESITFIEKTKSMLEQWEYEIDVENDGKDVVINLHGLKYKTIWKTKGRCFYMN